MAEPELNDFLEQGQVPQLLKAVPELLAFVSLIRCQICYELMVSAGVFTPMYGMYDTFQHKIGPIHGRCRMKQKTFFFSAGISGTIPSRFLLQTGRNATTLTRHHFHHFPTLSLEHLKPIPNCLPSPTLLSLLESTTYVSRSTVPKKHLLCK
jgi:hypothetical protein